MNYQAYEEKMQRIAVRLNWIRKRRYWLLAGGIALLTLCATLLLMQGALLSDAVAPAEPLTYGSSPSFRANAFLGRVTYEYRAEGEPEGWSEEPPRMPGNYLARAVSHRTFGRVTHGAELAFTILPAPLTLRPADQVIYGDLPTGVAHGLQYGDRLSCTVLTGKEDATGFLAEIDPASVRILDAAGNDVTAAYLLTYEPQSVTILPRPITVSLSSAEKIYDGTPLSATGYRITEGSLVEGDELRLHGFPELTDVTPGGLENRPSSIRVTTSTGVDHSARYRITTVSGRLTILPRPITVRTESAEKIYDGTDLFATEVTLVEGTLVEGQTMTYDLAAGLCALRTAGSIENRPGIRISYYGSGRDCSNNYSITYQCGTLTVHPRPICVRASSYTWYYDREVHHGEDLSPMFTMEKGEGFYSMVTGDVITFDGGSQIQPVGSVSNVLVSPKVVDGDGNDVTSSYAITCLKGTLTVLPCPITIRPLSQTWEYSGVSEAEKQSWVIPEFGYPDGTLPGLSNGNVIDITMPEAVRPLLMEEYRAYYSPDSFPVDAGTYVYNPLEIQIQDTALQNKDVTEYFEIYTVSGEFTVSKRNIRLTTSDKSWVYDGLEHSNPYCVLAHLRGNGLNWTVDTTVSALAVAHSIEVEITASLTDAGTRENRPSSVIIRDHTGRDVTVNYNIQYNCGTLTVVPRPLYLIPQDVSLVYNGEYQSPSSAEGYYKEVYLSLGEGKSSDAKPLDGAVLYEGLLRELGHYLKVVRTDGMAREAGVHTFSLTSANVWDANNRDVTHNYAIEFLADQNRAHFYILPRPITITTESAQKLFDGTVLRGEKFWVSQGPLVEGHTLEGEAWGEQLGVGSSKTLLQWFKILDAEGENVTHNYIATTDWGWLTVLERPETPLLEIRPYHIQRTYTGTEVSCPNNAFWIAAGGEHLPKGYRIETEIQGTYVEIGDWETRFLWIRIYDAEGNDITEQFSVKAPNGTISIQRIRLDISSESAQKIYDGKPLTNSVSYISFGRLLEGHSLVATVSGEQTEVGSSRNEIVSAVIFDEMGNDVSSYYEINLKPGTLTVHPDPDQPTPDVDADRPTVDVPEEPAVPPVIADETEPALVELEEQKEKN